MKPYNHYYRFSDLIEIRKKGKMMEKKPSSVSPTEKAKMALAMNRGDGMPPEAVVLTDDLSKSYPKQEDGEAFLKQCGFLAAEIAGILQKAYSK